MVKDRTNISIDYTLKKEFEALKPIHGYDLSGFVELSIKNLIGDIAPDIFMELQIAEAERKLAEMKEGLLELKFLADQKRAEEKMKKVKKEAKASEEDRLLQFREGKYNAGKERLAIMFKNRAIDWNTIRDLYRFRDKYEAQDWIESKLENDKLIESRYL